MISKAHLAQAVGEGQRLDADGLHARHLLLVEVLQLVHRQVPVAVYVHAPGTIDENIFKLRSSCDGLSASADYGIIL